MYTDIQIEAQKRLDERKDTEKKWELMCTAIGTAVFAFVPLPGAKNVFSLITKVVPTIHGYFYEDYWEEVKRVARGEQDYLPDPPGSDGEAYGAS